MVGNEAMIRAMDRHDARSNEEDDLLDVPEEGVVTTSPLTHE